MPRRSLFSDALPAELVKTGLPAFLMTVLDNISCAAAGHLMGLEGLAHQAGISVAKKLNLLAHSIARGMAQGVLPLLAYHDAAGERGKVLAVLRFSMCVSVGLALLCTGIGLVFAETLAGLFLEKSGASGAYAAHFLRIFALGAPWSAAAYACISLFQATGNSLLSLALACARKGALDIPLMLLLRIPLAADGIIWATPVADALCCLMAAAALRRFVRPAAQHQKSRQDGEAALSAGEL